MSRYLVEGRTGPFEVVIGLEIHAQISSQAKLFSGAPTAFGGDPNTQVSLVDAAFPGMLPVINGYCVEQAIKTGLGLHAEIHLHSVFDRKNYFYADLPQGYQISQFHHPIVGKGYLDIQLSDQEPQRIGITRIHLEQDAGKSIHDQHPSKSFIDLNRSGIALMEIVSEPDLRSALEAMEFVKRLRALVRYLGSCDGNMEQGSMRADVNVSLRRPGEPFGTRAEIKNVNSIRFMGQTIQHEIQRQMDIIESGGVIVQETRLFDPVKGETRSMRSKENANDYRYFPDPDLPPLIVDMALVNKIRDEMPELPSAKKKRFIESLSLSPYDADLLTSEKEIADYYEAALLASSDHGQASGKLLANWMLGELFAALNRDNLSIMDSKISPEALTALIDLIQRDVISGKIAKDVFLEMWDTQKDPQAIVKEKGLEQISDTGVIREVIRQIIVDNDAKVQEYRGGKDKLFGFFVGLSMKATAGKANPEVLNQLLKEELVS